jgi:hypothetical protein
MLSNDGRIYVAETTNTLGVKDPLRSVHATPEEAFEAVVNHAGERPDTDPEWPDDWGDEMWGWKPDGGPSYTIAQYVWSGVVTAGYDDFPAEPPALGVDDDA